MAELLRSKGCPQYTVWVLNSDTKKWDCWGEVHTPDDYPNMLDLINQGYFHNTRYAGNHYDKIYYLKNDGTCNTPNRMGLT